MSLFMEETYKSNNQKLQTKKKHNIAYKS